VDIAARIQQLEEMIKVAKSMPLSSSVLVNRDEILELIEGMRTTLPEEIRQARWVVKDREELLAKARRDAEAILQQAGREQARLLAEQELVVKANQEAERILEQARDRARQVSLETDDYVDARLAAFEAVLQQLRERIEKTMHVVDRGRQRLHGTHADEHLGEEAPEGEGADLPAEEVQR